MPTDDMNPIAFQSKRTGEQGSKLPLIPPIPINTTIWYTRPDTLGVIYALRVHGHEAVTLDPIVSIDTTKVIVLSSELLLKSGNDSGESYSDYHMNFEACYVTSLSRLAAASNKLKLEIDVLSRTLDDRERQLKEYDRLANAVIVRQDFSFDADGSFVDCDDHDDHGTE